MARGKGMKRKGGKARKYPIARGLGGVPDTASLTENIGLSGSSPFYSTNVSYKLYDVSLASCPRATAVGQAYQEYRIRRISLVYKTSLDTFAGAGYNCPQLFYMIDKRGAVPAGADAQVLRQMGATPHRFDDKNITVKWAPAVLQASLSDPAALTSTASAAEISPWLPTNNQVNAPGVYIPSDVDHLGITWYSYVPSAASAIFYDIDIYVDLEFRKPRWNTPVPPPGARVLNWNEKLAEVPETPVEAVPEGQNI